ncbi:MAG TPA: hypothetical protein DD435_10175 [Cyanobacteria bacterium UBA8530]|nr:hypothetical protein [Cyanobacteria bacterium UBA8530]
MKKPGRKAALAFSIAIISGCATLGGNQTGIQSDSIDTLRAQFSSGTRNILVDVYQTDKSQLTKLAEAGMDIWEVKKTYARGSITADQIKTLNDLGLKFKRLPDQRMKGGFDAGYRTFDKMVVEMKELAAKYPNICKLKDIGDGWEKTQKLADRDIWALHIGTGDTTAKPAVLFVGNHHAREIVTPEVVLNMAHLLCEQYGKDADITSYVENRDIWLVATANPDGHLKAEKGAMWRKNTDNSNGGGTSGGVDLNRNYDGYDFGGAGCSHYASSDTYCGPKPFSEPETQAMRDLMLSRKFTFLMTFHSYGNLIMWPWQGKNEPPADQRLAAIGKKMGAYTPSYTPEQGNELYLTTGDDTDWAYMKTGALAYCIEIGNEFMPHSNKLKQHFEEVKPFMLYALKVADNPARVWGPELSVQSQSGSIQAKLPAGVQKVEYFLDRPGIDGKGIALSPNSNTLSIKSVGRRLAYVHAVGANGQWGPFQSVWTN